MRPVGNDDPRYRPELRARAVALYNDGERTLREVGLIMGISHERVRKLVIEGGGKLASSGPRGGKGVKRRQ